MAKVYLPKAKRNVVRERVIHLARRVLFIQEMLRTAPRQKGLFEQLESMEQELKVYIKMFADARKGKVSTEVQFSADLLGITADYKKKK